MIVRRDLPLGFLAAQVVHAAGETSPGNIPPETNAVVLAVEGEPALHRVAARLARAGVAHRVIREPDPPWLGAATAIGIAPGERARLRRHVSDLSLLRQLGDVAQNVRAPADPPEAGAP